MAGVAATAAFSTLLSIAASNPSPLRIHLLDELSGRKNFYSVKFLEHQQILVARENNVGLTRQRHGEQLVVIGIAAYVVISAHGNEWTLEEAGDRDPSGARVGAIACPSEVLVSQTIKDLTAGFGIAYNDRGEHELKGVPDRWRLYRVVT